MIMGGVPPPIRRKTPSFSRSLDAGIQDGMRIAQAVLLFGHLNCILYRLSGAFLHERTEHGSDDGGR